MKWVVAAVILSIYGSYRVAESHARRVERHQARVADGSRDGGVS